MSSQPPQRHRLLLLSPFFAGLVVCSAVSVAGPLPASIADRSESAARSEMPAVVASQGLLQVALPQGTLFAWHGAVHLSPAPEGVTVAALTSPAVVQASGALIAVPQGWQRTVDSAGKAHSLHPLSASFLRTHLPEAMRLHTAAPVAPDDVFVGGGMPASLMFPALMTDAAEQRVRARTASKRVRLMADRLAMTAVGSLDPAIRAEMPVVLEHANRHDAAVLLSLAVVAGEESAALPPLMNDPVLRLLLTLHPAVRDRALLLSVPAMGRTAEMQRLMLQPIADTLAEPIHFLSAERWEHDLAAFIAADADPAMLLHQLLPFLHQGVARFAALQYPDRAQRYGAAILRIAEPYRLLLSSEAARLLHALTTYAAAEPSPIPAMASASSPSSEPASFVTDPAVLAAQTRDRLLQHGYMLTVQSHLAPVAPASVHVDNVVLGGKNGDHLLSFTYDASSGLVRGTDASGASLPYAVSLEEYTAWLRGQ